jgi:hypothetical protein
MTQPQSWWDTRLDSLDGVQRASFGCERRIRLLPLGVDLAGPPITTNCGSRLAERCAYCSRLYAGDAAKLLRLGTVESAERFLWMTTTLPSFGSIHLVPSSLPRTEATKGRKIPRRGRFSRCDCGMVHAPEDNHLRGVPTRLRVYDYDAAVLHNFLAGRLASRTSQRFSRYALNDGHGYLPYVRAMEWQKRLSVHFHYLIRVPVGVQLDLAEFKRVVLDTFVHHRRTGTQVQWGSQLDITEIDLTTAAGRTHAVQTAGYLGKVLTYSVKDLGLDVPSTGGTADKARHARSMRAAAARLLLAEGVVRKRQHVTFGWNGQVFRTSGSWAPQNMSDLRRARADYKAATGAPAKDIAYVAVPLARAVTVGDAISQKEVGYSDQDFADAFRPFQSGLVPLPLPSERQRRPSRRSSRSTAVVPPLLCRTCRTSLDPSLATYGLHIGCEMKAGNDGEDMEEYD